MGVITELVALKFNVSPEMRAFLTTGILGGYTTFSTFSLESAVLIERGAYVTAASYVVGSAVLSITGSVRRPVDRARDLCLSFAPSIPTMTASAWTAGSSGIIRHVTHVLLEKLLRKGEVRLDGKRAKSADRIAAGQAMRLPPQVVHAKDQRAEKPKPRRNICWRPATWEAWRTASSTWTSR